MDTERLIRLLIRTLGKRGVRRAIQDRVTGNKTETPEQRRKAQQVNHNMMRASRAFRTIRRMMKMR